MIKLTKINKYFNRNKSNELHVLKDISLSLPDKGLVTLFGASGSGKSTLLNVIGGLDSADGSIMYDEISLDKYAASLDSYRSKNIGYVFQNYLLLPNVSVYRNIEISLNLIGIYDSEEIDKRINHSLDAVGLLNFKRRKASRLSGGQQQRVSIARALAKNSKVIIADEPTGNLDSENTVEIMNIFKQVSKSKLVILVTHNKAMADFYSDIIYHISDGTITKIEENITSNELDYRNENNIYLGELEKNLILNNDNKINIYSDHSIQDIEMNLIIYKNKVYLKSSADAIKLIDSESNINLIEGVHKKITKDTMDTFNYSTESFSEESNNPKNIVFKSTIKEAISSFINVKGRHKIMYLFLFLMGVILVFIGTNISKKISIDESTFLNFDPSTSIIEKFENKTPSLSNLAYLAYENDLDFSTLAGTSFYFKLDNFYQIDTNITEYGSTIIRQKYLPENIKVVHGDISKEGIVIDLYKAENFLKVLNRFGIYRLEDLIDLEIYASNDKYLGSISAIVERYGNVVFLNDNAYYNLNQFEFFHSNYRLDEAKNPDSGSKINHDLLEVIVPVNSELNIGDTFPIDFGQIYGMESEFKELSTIQVKVVGKSNDEWTYVSKKILNRLCIYRLSVSGYYDNSDVFFHLQDKEINELAKSCKIANAYDYKLNEFKKENNFSVLALIISSLIIIIIVVVYIYFLMRTRMLNRVYEIGTYRALGASKKQIRRKFFYETIVLITPTLILGYLLGIIVLLYASTLVKNISILAIVLNPFVMIILLVFVVLMSLIFGLLPVNSLLKKTPAEIISKYDI